ncbi:TIGR03086 family metal-binding protein [Streptomyces sp. NPDC050560]|uniref:TIGR03086 family metal-binding protein n=1 Tax=Streptomyces sp. NPDC050560 TaxID=3365630 RepID=UPI0037983F4C
MTENKISLPPVATDRPVGELLGMAAGRAVPVVAAIRDDQLAEPTPCAEYDVRALVNHLFQVVVEFRKLAGKGLADFGAQRDFVGAADGGADWRARFAAAADELVAAWSAPGADEGVTGMMDLPAVTVGCMALTDLVLHAWDLARATGADYPEGEDIAPVLATLDAATEQMAPMARSAGVFGEPVPVAADAPRLHRLVAATGRDPRWQAPGAA